MSQDATGGIRETEPESKPLEDDDPDFDGYRA